MNHLCLNFSIIKEKFNEEAYWTIKKLSLFVGSCSSGQGRGQGRNAKVVLAFENEWKTLDEETSFTTDQTGIYTFYLHNLNRNKEFAVNLRVNPPPCMDEVSLGVVEDTTGISDELVSILSGADYDSLRNLWKFPPGKDFAIFIDQQEIIGGKRLSELAFKDGIEIPIDKIASIQLPYRYRIIKGEP